MCIRDRYRLTPTNKIVAISSGRCGDANATVANETWDIESAYRTDVNGSNASYDFGLPVLGVAGSYFRLCWAHNATNISDFKFEIDGSAELAGPYVDDLECTLGLQCLMDIEGYRLAPTNKLVAISSGRCGDANATVAVSYTHLTLPTILLV